VGSQVGVLSGVRKSNGRPIREQSPCRRFPLRGLQGGIRAEEPKGEVREQSARWRVWHDVRSLGSPNNPNLFLLNYDLKQFGVTNLFVVPKQFFVREIIEKRKPLAPTARRAGWVGCNILLGEIPASGKIFLVRDGQLAPKEAVLAQWQKTLFLRDEGVEARGWLIEVMKCVELIGKREFQLEDVYAFESRLSQIYPDNNNVRPKIRQQLQVLRDRGYLDFVSRGYYRLRSQD
jgi:type II restriction enzyme